MIPGHQLGLIQSNLSPKTALPGENISVDIRWGTNGGPDDDFLAHFRLLDERNNTLQQWNKPVIEDWPTSEWEPGDFGHALYSLKLQDDTQPGTYMLGVALKNASSGELSRAIAIDRIHIADANNPQAGMCYEDFHFGEHITLRQTQITPANPSPGDTLTLKLIWESDGSVEESYKIFCHLLSQNNKLIAQQDRIPLNGARPTWSWRAGEVIEDSCKIPLKTNLSDGTYDLSIGIYDPESMNRIPLYSSTGSHILDNQALITRIELKE